MSVTLMTALSFSSHAQTKNINKTNNTKVEKIEVITRNNPFGLVYDGAITENAAGKVNIHPVHYQLKGIDIAANVYTPANYDESKKYPAIVIAGKNGQIDHPDSE